MSALIWKDCYVLVRQLRLFLVLLVVCALLPDAQMAIFAIIYASMMPFTAMAYDEQSKWDQLAAMMPYTPFQIVFGKYLLAYGGILLTGGLSIAGQSLMALVRGGAAELAVYVGIMLAALLMTALVLPLLFRFGVEKGRIAFLILIGAGTGSIYALSGDMLWLTELPLAAAALGVVALNVLSVVLSQRFHLKKQYG